MPAEALTWNEFWEPFVEHVSHNSGIRNKTEYCYKVVKYEEYVPGNEFSSGYVRHRSEKYTIHCPFWELIQIIRLEKHRLLLSIHKSKEDFKGDVKGDGKIIH